MSRVHSRALPDRQTDPDRSTPDRAIFRGDTLTGPCLAVAYCASYMSGGIVAGLVEPLADAMQVPAAVTGLLAVTFSAGALVTLLLGGRLLAGCDVGAVLLGGVLSLAVLLAAIAGASDIVWLAVGFATLGSATGIVSPTVFSAAWTLALPGRDNAAMSWVHIGMLVAVVVGLPLTSWLAANMSWRLAPIAVGALALLAGGMTRRLADAGRVQVQGGFSIGTDAIHLAALFAAVNGVATFLGPTAAVALGSDRFGLPLLQLATGGGGIVGLLAIRRMVDTQALGWRKPLSIGLTVILAAQTAILLLASVGGFRWAGWMLVPLAIGGGVAFFSLTSLCSAAIARATGPAHRKGFILVILCAHVGGVIGVLIGSVAIRFAGISSLGVAMAVVAGLLLVPQGTMRFGRGGS